ncbi:MAG: hypothetical protein F4007_11245 [Chloroflexi bacterium]|nr:hypothetical protein [Chloroflexota bacterium]
MTSAATAAVGPKPNSPATGAPTITGTVRVGGTLTASTSGISDDDGLDNATFTYQWLAGDADISGATGSTYTLVSADQGKTVTVQVGFTDDAGHEESLTSAATAAVAAAAPPSVTGVAVTSTPSANSTYGSGQTIRVTLTFSEAVDVTGTPRLKIKMDPNYGEKWAAYEGGSGTAQLVFAHTVVEPNVSTQGIAVLTNTLALNGGTIRSGSVNATLAHAGIDHDASHKVDWRVGAPSVTGVAVTSAPGADSTYALDETIRVTVTFDGAVDVTGTPRLKIKMDPNYGEKWAGYESGSGTTGLVFTHTVVEPNISTQGIAVLANTLELNGGTIASASANAALSHDGLGHDADHKVDWQTEASVEKPGQPENLAITATDNALEVSATWDATAGATSYKLGWRPTDGSGLSGVATDITGTSATATVLKSGEWHFYLIACNTAGCGNPAVTTVEVVPARAQSRQRNVVGDQTAEVLVSNVGQTNSNLFSLATGSEAQGFTTGTHSAGYALSTIEVNFTTTAANSNIVVELATGLSSGSSTTNVVATLTNPSSFGTGNVTFTAPAGTTLKPSTQYWVVMTGSSGWVQATNTNGQTGATGWSISDTSLRRAADGTGNWSTSSHERKIRVNGYAIPPKVSNTGQTDQHTSAGDKMSFGRNNAQGFTTGSNPGGYTLTRVDFEISIVSGTTPTVAYSLEIRKPGSSGRPGGDLVGTMTNPSDFTGTVDSYTHDGLELEPNTEYFAVFNVTTTSTNVVLESTASDDEDSGAADGWSINDKRWAKTSTGTGWADEDEKDSALQIAVYATEKPQKLVRNTGQAVSSTTTFSGRDGTDFWHHAQGFTTGSNSDGYTLSEVDVRLSSVGSAATPRVRIFSSSGSSPNAGLYVLNNPSSFADGAVNTFTAPANATLSANTTYFVVVETTATAQDDNNRITLTLTSSASEDTDGLSGWSVADVRHTKEMDDTSWASTTGLRMMVALRGTVIDNTAPTALISVLDSTAKTAAITFDEDLKTDTPAVSQFALQDDSGADIASTNPSSVSISGTVVTATFGSIPTNAVKIKYTPSSADTDNPLQDASGNKVAAFSQTLSGSMVGNIGQTSDGSFGMPTHEWAQAFTTGSDSDGYTLTGIELDFDQVGTGDPSFTVQVCTGTNTNPANSCLGTLTHPSSLPADVNTFTAGSDGITLSADTTYYVVVDVAVSSGNAGFFVSTISSDSEDTGGLTGWGIANGGLTRTLAAGATWSADTKSLVMRLLGPVKAGTDTADPLPKVSNIDQAHGSDVYGFTGSQQRAQGFTTGANANGYTLNSVDVKFGNAATSGVVVRLATGPAAGNSNATFVATLTHPSDYSALNTTFTAPAGTTLKPNTTYYVVLSGTSNATVRLTASNNEDSGAATGWSVADAILTRSSGTANWAADSSGDAGMIRVYATERGPTLISNTGQTAGSGRIAVGHSTNAIWSHALSFTTGGSGVTLGEVDLRLASGGVGSGATPRVSIYSASGGNPGSSLYVLTNPSSFKASAVNTFTAPANSTLDANTTYFVVLETTATTLDNTNRIFVSYTASSAEDTGGKSGWSIGDGRRTRSGSGAWTSPTDGFLPLIALRATFDASADTTAPKVTNVVLHQGHIDVVFDEDLDTSSKPAHGQFEVSINAVDISNPNWQPTPTGVKFKTNAPNTIELDFGFNLGAATNTVNWLTYTKPTTNPLKDGAGNEVATFTYGQRTTTPSTPPGTPPSTPPGTPPSTPPGTPPTPPTSSPGRSEGIPRHVSSALSGGIYLTLTFSEDLVEVSQSSLLYAFGYGINGGPYTSPSAATMRGATVVLTLRDTVKATDTLRIHCCSGILRDEDGIRVPEFVSYLRPVPPENTGTWISGDKQISLTWSEPLQTVDEDSLKWAFSYRVKVDGEWSTYGPWKDPTGATLVGNKVVLTIPDSLSAMNTVNVLYNGGLLKDHDGLAAAGFSTFIYPDPPEHIGTEVTGDYEITLTYDEQLMDVELSTYYFIITLPGGNWSKPTNAEVDGDTVVLTTKHKVKGPWSVKLNVFGRQIKDLDGLPDPYDYVTYVWGGG